MPERCAPATQMTLLSVNESLECFGFKKLANSYVELINTTALRRVNPVGTNNVFGSGSSSPVAEFDSFLLVCCYRRHHHPRPCLPRRYHGFLYLPAVPEWSDFDDRHKSGSRAILLSPKESIYRQVIGSSDKSRHRVLKLCARRSFEAGQNNRRRRSYREIS